MERERAVLLQATFEISCGYIGRHEHAGAIRNIAEQTDWRKMHLSLVAYCVSEDVER